MSTYKRAVKRQPILQVSHIPPVGQSSQTSPTRALDRSVGRGKNNPGSAANNVQLDLKLGKLAMVIAMFLVMFLIPVYLWDNWESLLPNESARVSSQGPRVAGVSTNVPSAATSTRVGIASSNNTSLNTASALMIGGGILVLAPAGFLLIRRFLAGGSTSASGGNAFGTRGFAIAAVAMGFVTFAQSAFAQAAGDIQSPTSITITQLFQSIVSLLVPIILLVLVGMIIYGGYVRMTAAGDAEKEQQSNQILTAAIIGFIIIALSPLIINLLGQFLGTGRLIG